MDGYPKPDGHSFVLIFIGLVFGFITACGNIALPQNQPPIPQKVSPLSTPASQIGQATPTTRATVFFEPTTTLEPSVTPTRQSTPFLVSTPTSTGCEPVGQWESYTDPVAGYSLQYPAEAEFSEHLGVSSRYISVYLKPNCYNVTCWGLNRVIVSVSQNPQDLPVQEFIKQKFHLYSNPPDSDSVRGYEETSRFVEVDGIQSVWIEDGIGADQPDIFIPHGKSVIHIYIMTDARKMPPYGPPCDKTLELLTQILASIKLQS